MEALLGAAKRNPSLDSTEQLQAQFSQAFASKVKPNRAEHLSASYEFRSDVLFQLSVTEAENETLSNAARNDAATGGGALGTGRAQALGDGKYLHRIRSSDVVMNQPQDEPIFQRAVCKHIIGVLSSIDGSDWAVRSMARGAQGWTFTYSCKDSMQTWLRARGKASRPVVGESSGKDGQDPINLGRPAFDCRGVVVISFSQSNRSVTVSYEHTRLHKTVSQMAELYVLQAEPAPRGPRGPYKKRKADGQPEGEARRKSKKKKSGEAAEAGATGETAANDDGAANGDVDGTTDGTTNGTPNATPNETPNGKPRRKRPYKKSQADDVGAGSDGAASPGAPALISLNLPPGEAARRTDVANQLLQEAGIDPQTLSQEQFGIFANQSPELQRESLSMLINYGAERLRIVHPNKDTASPSPASSPDVSTIDGTPDPPTQRRQPRKKSNPGGQDGDEDVVAGNETPSARQPRPLQTRGKCQGCKAEKVKCSKEKPSCRECSGAGRSCYYAPPKRKSQAPADGEYHGNEAVEEAPEDASEPAVEAEPAEEEEPDDLPSPGFSQPLPPNQPPAPGDEDLTGSVGHYTSDWNQSVGGITYPQPLNQSVAQQAMVSASRLDYSQVTAQPAQLNQSQSDLGYSQQGSDQLPGYQDRPSATSPQLAPRGTRSSLRRSQAHEQRNQHQTAGIDVSTHDAAASGWKEFPNGMPAYPDASSLPSSLSYGSQDHDTGNTAGQGQQSYDTQQSTAYSRAGPQQSSRPQSSSIRSPLQTPAGPPPGAKSRIGRGGQNRTPPGPRQVPSSASQQGAGIAGPSLVDTSTFGSASAHNAYSNYTGGWKDSAAPSTQYQHQPYPAQTAATTTSYGTYNTRSASAAPSYSHPVSQSLPSSYTTAPSGPWSSSNQTSYGYDANESDNLYGMPSKPPAPSNPLPSFGGRPLRGSMHLHNQGGYNGREGLT